MSTCTAPGTNHSPDLITVYSGSIPRVMCGYHASQGITAYATLIETDLA